MSWAEIKKAVNSDLDTPLDELLKNTTYGLSAIKAAITALSTGGTVPIVKSVQRGRVSIASNTTSYSQNISSVNTNKSILILSGDGVMAASTSGSLASFYSGYLSSGTQIAINTCRTSSIDNGYINWQVIEFY